MLRVAYDIRGIYPDDVNEELAHRLGYVFGREKNTVVVARDFRRGSDELYSSLVDGLLSANSTVYSLDSVPTPVLSFAIRNLGADGGIMVTASHNPPNYNGFKLFDSWGAVIQKGEIEALLCVCGSANVRDGKDGQLIPTDVSEQYLGATPNHPKRRVIVDFNNGVGVWYRPLFEERFDLLALNDAPDPDFRAGGPEPTPDHAERIANLVADEHADFALLLDGDADRSVFADARGFLNPSLLFVLFGQWFLHTNRGNVFVASVDISPRVAHYLPGARVVRTRIGTAFIVDKVREVGASFSGEYSCHFTAYCFSGHSDPSFFTSILANYDTTVERKRYPFHSLLSESYFVDDPASLVARASRLGKVVGREDGVEFLYEGHRVLVRPSNTEQKLRIYVEGPHSKSVLRDVLRRLNLR